MGVLINLTRQKFNSLTAVRFDERRNRRTYWVWECDCGNFKSIESDSVKRGNTKTCGECADPEKMAYNFIDRIGHTYGSLTVIDRATNNKWSQARWNCKCECGRSTIVDAANLMTGHTVSCGRCLLVVDLTGNVFGELTVLHLINSERRGPLWACVCSCSPNTVLEVSGHNLRSGLKSCGCSRQVENHWKWGGRIGEISTSYWTRLLTQARDRDIEVTVDHQYIADLYDQQHGRCALTNIELIPPRINKTGWTASLDRIDNEIGYGEGNVQWVHKDINIMKRNHTLEHFVDMCVAVAEFKGVTFLGGTP